MREAKTRMNLQMFAKAVNLNPDQTIVQIHELTHEGFIRKTDSGYGLTEKGKNALKITTPFSDEVAFCFYLDIDKPMGFSAHSIEEFYFQSNRFVAILLNSIFTVVTLMRGYGMLYMIQCWLMK